MRISDIKSSLTKAINAKDFVGEFSSANIELHKQRLETFEAVLTGNGSEKCLIPEIGTVHYLYRGQNSEYVPCLPTIYRGNPSDEKIFFNRMRLVAFKRLLDTHPVIQHFFRRHNFLVSVEGLAQHYGIETEVLDLTSNLDVALFFAVCKYNAENDSYDYYREGGHKGVLYVFDPFYDNDTIPLFPMDSYMNGLIKPIGLQAFQRPSAQYGYGLHLKKGKSTKSWMFEFEFTSQESEYYYNLFKGGESLWVKDRLVPKVKQIIGLKEFSYNIFNEAFAVYRPRGWSANKMKNAVKGLGVQLSNRVDDILFTESEIDEIVNEWNDYLGCDFASKIVRKEWYQYKDDGRRIKMDFMTMGHLAEYFALLSIAHVDGPDGAVWRNYTGKPYERREMNKNGVYDYKVDRSFQSVFGKAFLNEEDWVIKLG